METDAKLIANKILNEKEGYRGDYLAYYFHEKLKKKFKYSNDKFLDICSKIVCMIVFAIGFTVFFFILLLFGVGTEAKWIVRWIANKILNEKEDYEDYRVYYFHEKLKEKFKYSKDKFLVICSKIYEQIKKDAMQGNRNAILHIINMYGDACIDLSYDEITQYCLYCNDNIAESLVLMQNRRRRNDLQFHVFAEFKKIRTRANELEKEHEKLKNLNNKLTEESKFMPEKKDYRTAKYEADSISKSNVLTDTKSCDIGDDTKSIVDKLLNIKYVADKILNKNYWYEFYEESKSKYAANVFRVICAKIYEQLKIYAFQGNMDAIKRIIDMQCYDCIDLFYDEMIQYCLSSNDIIDYSLSMLSVKFLNNFQIYFFAEFKKNKNLVDDLGKKINEELAKEIEIKFRPGGDGYREAKHEFDLMSKT